MSRIVWLGGIAVALFFAGVVGYAIGDAYAWAEGYRAGWRARGGRRGAD